MPFFKVTLVFQRCFLTKSLVEYLNDDFKESVHDMSTGLKAKLVGEMQQSAHLGNGQTWQGVSGGAWGSREVPPTVERAKRHL